MNRQDAKNTLDAALEARALNIEQARLLMAATGDAQSLALHIARLLRSGVDAAEVAEMTTLCRHLAESNHREGAEEMRLAAMAEALIARHLGAPVAERITIQSLARRLRPALATIDRQRCGEELDGIAFFQASCVVRDVIAQTDPERLLSRSMEHELRGRCFQLLEELVQAVAVEEEASQDA